MLSDVLGEFRWKLLVEGSRRLEYTREAFHMLPALVRPRILDAGCGEGGPALELARLSRGDVFGLDIRRAALDELKRRSEEAGLSQHIHPVTGSITQMPFACETFDIFWSEGSIHIVGFEEGLAEWRRFIRPGGFLVVHEMAWLQPDPPREIVDYWRRFFPGIGTVAEYVHRISDSGYNLHKHFPLPDDLWWVDYYGPLERRISGLREEYATNKEALRLLDGEQQEIDLYKRHSRWYGSAFFIMARKV